MSSLHELAGNDVVCHCNPLPCHGDVLVELANPKPRIIEEDEMSEREDAAESDVTSFAFNRKKVRYSILDGMIQDSIVDTSVTFFVDMRYVLDIMKIDYYRQAVEDEIVKNSNRVLAETLNLIVHYKRYLVEKRNCRVTFVLMFDSGKIDPIKAAIEPKYGTARTEKTVKPTFMGFLANKTQRISPCIPDLKVVDSKDHELSCIPFVLRDDIDSKYNIFLSNDPIIHQASQFYKGFSAIHANGEHSKVIGRKGYFRYLYEKHKWASKDEQEPLTDPSYIRLYLNLTGGDDDCPIDTFKNKKAVNLINKLKQSNIKLIGYDEIQGSLGLSEEHFELLKHRDACYNGLAHAAMLGEAEAMAIRQQFLEKCRISRSEFAHYNNQYFNNIVDEPVLFQSN
jgi:hypothetical protein